MEENQQQEWKTALRIIEDIAKAKTEAEIQQKKLDLEQKLKTIRTVINRRLDGETLLSIAVTHFSDESVAKILIDNGAQISDEHLIAIISKRLKTMNFLLNCLGGKNEQKAIGFEGRFSSDSTPLLIAASRSDLRAIFELLQRGHLLPKLQENNVKQNFRVMRAKANPAYIRLTTDGKFIETCLSVCRDIKDNFLSGQYAMQFLNLTTPLQVEATSLLLYCRTEEEVAIIFKHKYDFQEKTVAPFPGLEAAIYNDWELYLSCEPTQNFCNEVWLHGANRDQNRLSFKELLFLLPFLQFSFMVKGFTPQAKFLAHIINETFLSLLCFFVTEMCKSEYEQKDHSFPSLNVKMCLYFIFGWSFLSLVSAFQKIHAFGFTKMCSNYLWLLDTAFAAFSLIGSANIILRHSIESTSFLAFVTNMNCLRLITMGSFRCFKFIKKDFWKQFYFAAMVTSALFVFASASFNLSKNVSNPIREYGNEILVTNILLTVLFELLSANNSLEDEYWIVFWTDIVVKYATDGFAVPVPFNLLCNKYGTEKGGADKMEEYTSLCLELRTRKRLHDSLEKYSTPKFEINTKNFKNKH